MLAGRPLAELLDEDLVTRRRDGRLRAAVRVRDQGLGMTPQQHAQVFGAFYRVDRDSSVPGSGLGTTILKEIVALHGGQITLESKLGVGTEVTLCLSPAITDDDG